MDEPVNPYASSQADITQVPFAEGALNDLPGLRTTGIGLTLVYYGMIVTLLAVMGMFVSVFLFFGRPSGGMAFTLIAIVALLVGYLMNFAGQIVCVAVPSQTGAKTYAILAMVLQLAGIAQSFLPLIQRFVPSMELFHPVTILLNSLGSVSLMFFVLFMRKLSISLGRRDLANRARNVLVLGAIAIGILAVLLVGLRILQNESFGLLALVLIVVGLILFVMCVNLVNALRKILLRAEPQSN